LNQSTPSDSTRWPRRQACLLVQSQRVFEQGSVDVLDSFTHVSEHPKVAFLAQSGRASLRILRPLGDEGSMTVTCT